LAEELNSKWDKQYNLLDDELNSMLALTRVTAGSTPPERVGVSLNDRDATSAPKNGKITGASQVSRGVVKNISTTTVLRENEGEIEMDFSPSASTNGSRVLPEPAVDKAIRNSSVRQKYTAPPSAEVTSKESPLPALNLPDDVPVIYSLAGQNSAAQKALTTLEGLPKAAALKHIISLALEFAMAMDSARFFRYPVSDVFN
jgi:hypothetical protein